MTGGPFTRRGGRLLAAVAAVSLVAAGLLGVFGDELSEPPSSGADAFSRSAIGHAALVALLRELDLPLIVSRHGTAGKVEDGAVAVLLEPRLEAERAGPRAGALDEVVRAADALLVVLPRRTGTPDPIRPRWLGAARELDHAEAERILAALGIEGVVTRPARASAWRGPLPAPALDAPQLVRAPGLVPLVESDEGVLAGELRRDGRHVVVLADPDVVAAHGLGRGDNAVLAVRLLERLGAGERTLVVDETLHGNGLEPSLARELFRFPLVLATLQALLVAGLLAWAALVRFGRPAPPPAGLAQGKGFLVENTAELLRHGEHVRHAVAAYLRAAREAVAHRLRSPADRAGEEQAWLAALAAARGRGEALAALEARVQALPAGGRGAEDEAIRTAQAIHAFREEMTDGAPGDPRSDRAAQG